MWLTGLVAPRHVDLPGPGFEPVCSALAGRFSTTAPPGKPHGSFLPDFPPISLLQERLRVLCFLPISIVYFCCNSRGSRLLHCSVIVMEKHGGMGMQGTGKIQKWGSCLHVPLPKSQSLPIIPLTELPNFALILNSRW